MDAELFAQGEPHVIWRAMRERAPVMWHRRASGPGSWSVTRYADAQEILRDHETFSLAPG